MPLILGLINYAKYCKYAVIKDEMKEMLQFGANVIFKATDNTVSDELI